MMTRSELRRRGASYGNRGVSIGVFWFGFAVLVQRLCIGFFFFFFFLINTVLLLVCFAFALYCIDCISVLGIGFLCSDVTVGSGGAMYRSGCSQEHPDLKKIFKKIKIIFKLN